MKAKELKELSSEELLTKERNLKKDLFDLNYERKMGMVAKPARFRTIKRDIARIMTILREREIQNERESKK